MTRISVLVAALIAMSGCNSAAHLTYDFGRAATETYNVQTDLSRPSAADAQHSLTGNEAAAIRLNQRKSSTDEETAESELEQGS